MKIQATYGGQFHYNSLVTHVKSTKLLMILIGSEEAPKILPLSKKIKSLRLVKRLNLMWSGKSNRARA